MAYPVVRINNATGSNTAASGAGPDPALTGTQAATSADGLTVDLSLDNPDLSQVATDKSHVIWLSGTGGVEFGIITGVDNVAKTVTVETAFPANLTGLTWAIGGKRASLAATIAKTQWPDLAPSRAPVVVEVENTGTDYVAQDIDVSPRLWVRGVGMPRIVVPAAAATGFKANIVDGRWVPLFDGLHVVSEDWLNTGTISTNVGIGSNNFNEAVLEVRGCLIEGFDRGISHKGNSWDDRLVVETTEVRNCTYGIFVHGYGQAGDAIIRNCYIHDCSQGIRCSTYQSMLVEFTIVVGCTIGIAWSNDGYGPAEFRHVSVVDCADSFSMENAATKHDVKFRNVIAYGGSGYAIKIRYTVFNYEALRYLLYDRRQFAFGAKTGGFSNYLQQQNEIVLGADPFVDRANGNYELNDDPNGGGLLKNVGWPTSWPGLPNTGNYPDVGGVVGQTVTGSSGGGGTSGAVSLARIFSGM